MALWTNDRKCLGVGRSGLQYRKIMPCSVPDDDARSIVAGFFRSHGAIPCEDGAGNDGPTMTFTRGSRFLSWFTWLLPIVAAKMTPGQIAEARQLSREWKPKKER